MTNKRYSYIPQRMKSVNKEDPYVTGAEDIDAGNGKSQQVKNTETDETLTQLSNEIDAVNKQDIIPVDTLPAVATADPKKIYRVVGEDSYTDYMVNASGDGWKELATYSFPGIDDEPTAGSDNPVKSGGIKNELALGAVYDVSAKNPTAGPNNDGKWESLSALLSDANLNTLIPTAVRKGGMSVKYVQSSDNKYVQARLMANSFTTDTTQWQGVDNELSADSDGMPKTKVVYNAIENVAINSVSSYNKTTALQIQRSIDRDTSLIAGPINTFGIWYAPCKAGEYIDVSKEFQDVTWASYINYGYTAVTPEVGVPVVGLGRKEGATHLEYHGKAPIDGFFIVEMYNNSNNLGLEITVGHLLKEDVNNLKEDVEELQEGTKQPNIFFGEDLIADKNNSRKGGYKDDGTWENNDGGSSAKYYVTDYIDVTKINSLRVRGFASNTNRLLVIAFNENKEVILSNSIVIDRIVYTEEYVVWTKLSGTKYVCISYNSDHENYCYEADSKHEIDKLRLGIDTDKRNLLDVYGVNNHYGLLYDGTITGLGGSSGTYAVSGYINVVGIKKLRIKGSAYISTSGYLNLAAYNYQFAHIESKSVKGMNEREFIWENDGSVSYIRIGYRTDLEAYCYNCSVYTDYTNKYEIQDVISPDDAQIIQLNDKPNMLTKLQNAIWGTIKPLSILHFSDIHGGKDELQRLLDFKSYFSNYIDIILNTGDTVDNSFADGIAWYEDVQGSGNILNVIGNHDNAAIVGGELDMEAHTGKECYDAYIAPFAENWDATFPTDAATAGKCYYYKDFATQNLRLIIVDVMHYDNTQDGWLADVLSDAKTNQLSVVIAAHNTPVGIDYIECSFSSKIFTGFNGVNWSGSASMWGTVQTFIDAGGKFLCYLVGHTHADIITVGHDYPKQLAIYVTTATTTYDEESNRVKWTKTEDDFNIVSFDTTRNIIKVIKAGCDYNAAMQHRDVLSIKVDYTATDKYTIMSE